MFGIEVLTRKILKERFIMKNGNRRWQDSIDKELFEIDEYQTFDDKGKGYRPGPDYKKIRVHLVFAVKHDGRHTSERALL